MLQTKKCLHCNSKLADTKPPETIFCSSKCKNQNKYFVRALSQQYPDIDKKYIIDQLKLGANIELDNFGGNYLNAITGAFKNLKTNPNFYYKVDDKNTNQSVSDAFLMQQYPRITPAQSEDIYYQTQQILQQLPTILNPQQINILEKYEGLGNQVFTGKTTEGLVHQFYTPYVIIKKMYELAQYYGFNGGNVVEPSCGSGRFFKLAPPNTNLIGFDIDETNIKIVSTLYPNVKLYHQAFETAFLSPPNYNKKAKSTWLPPAELVIGNPPYGKYDGYYKTYMPKNFNRFEFLFIKLGLDVLAPGGLLIYIVSQNLMNNGLSYNKMKQDILKQADFIDAYRLPNKIFTNTDIGTDIVIFRKK